MTSETCNVSECVKLGKSDKQTGLKTVVNLPTAQSSRSDVAIPSPSPSPGSALVYVMSQR